MLGQIVYIDPNFGHKSQEYGCYMFSLAQIWKLREIAKVLSTYYVSNIVPGSKMYVILTTPALLS